MRGPLIFKCTGSGHFMHNQPKLLYILLRSLICSSILWKNAAWAKDFENVKLYKERFSCIIVEFEISNQYQRVT